LPVTRDKSQAMLISMKRNWGTYSTWKRRRTSGLGMCVLRRRPSQQTTR
jgi:hypothetical protein